MRQPHDPGPEALRLSLILRKRTLSSGLRHICCRCCCMKTAGLIDAMPIPASPAPIPAASAIGGIVPGICTPDGDGRFWSARRERRIAVVAMSTTVSPESAAAGATKRARSRSMVMRLHTEEGDAGVGCARLRMCSRVQSRGELMASHMC